MSNQDVESPDHCESKIMEMQDMTETENFKNIEIKPNEGLTNDTLRDEAATPASIDMSDKTPQDMLGMTTKFSSTGTMSDLMEPNFYNRSHRLWVPDVFEILFELKGRGTTIKAEVYFGLIHFVSCFYVLAVVPSIMSASGYSKANIFTVTALGAGFGSIIGGFVSNLPFPVAPSTAVALFYQARLQSVGNSGGSAAVVLSGFIIIILGIKPIATFLRQLIPISIQVGTSVGIGIITALAGAIDAGIVETGDSTLLQFGILTPTIIITLFGVIIIPIFYHYGVRGPFAVTIVICSLLGWGIYNSWPPGVASIPTVSTFDFSSTSFQKTFVTLIFELVFLYFLYIHGLISSLSRLADLQEEDGSTPRMYSLYVISGVMTIASGALNGVPVLLSPEGASACHDGAKTGLSTVICGILFLLSIFFSPIFSSIPSAGSSPILIMVGVLLFQNVLRIDWTHIRICTPAFLCLFFIPFTYNLVEGVVLGYIAYIIINGATGHLFQDGLHLMKIYLPKLYYAHFAKYHEHKSEGVEGGHGNKHDEGCNHDSANKDNRTVGVVEVTGQFTNKYTRLRRHPSNQVSFNTVNSPSQLTRYAFGFERSDDSSIRSQSLENSSGYNESAYMIDI